MKVQHFLCALMVTFCVLFPAACPDTFAQQPQFSCGINATLAFAHVMGKQTKNNDAIRLSTERREGVMSLLEVQKLAATLNLDLVGVKASLSELLGKGEYAIIHLPAGNSETNSFGHFTVLLDQCSTNSQNPSQCLRLLETPDDYVRVVPRSESERRFDGYALILRDRVPSESPNVRFEDKDFSFGIIGVGQRVEHTYNLILLKNLTVYQSRGIHTLNTLVQEVSRRYMWTPLHVVPRAGRVFQRNHNFINDGKNDLIVSLSGSS